MEFEQSLRRAAATRDARLDTFPLSGLSTFAEFAERWMNDYVSIANRASTAKEKRSTLRCRLLPAFGHLPLNHISTNMVDAQVAIWMRSGIGIKRINNIMTIFRKALRCAVEWGLLAEEPLIRHHSYFPPVPQYLTRPESDRLLAVMEPGFWKTFVLFLLGTGVRFGEAAALQWSDLELEGGRPFVTIRRGVCYGIVSDTKTRASRRAIALVPELVVALRALRYERPQGDWIFTSPSGKFHRPDHCGHILKRACAKAGVPIITWHKLRHSCATQLMAEGVPLMAIKELLGHTSLEVTSIYTHVSPNLMWEYVQFMSSGRPLPSAPHGGHIPLPELQASQAASSSLN